MDKRNVSENGEARTVGDRPSLINIQNQTSKENTEEFSSSAEAMIWWNHKEVYSELITKE